MRRLSAFFAVFQHSPRKNDPKITAVGYTIHTLHTLTKAIDTRILMAELKFGVILFQVSLSNGQIGLFFGPSRYVLSSIAGKKEFRNNLPPLYAIILVCCTLFLSLYLTICVYFVTSHQFVHTPLKRKRHIRLYAHTKHYYFQGSFI